MKRIKGFMMILAAISCVPLVAGAAVTLPFSDSFEAGISNVWVGTGNVQTNSPVAKEGTGTYSMYVEEGATLSVGGSNPNVWFSFYAQMVPLPDGEDAPDISTNAAAFFMQVNTNDNTGTLRAYDSNTYVNVKTGLVTNGWHGFAVHLDFVNETWNLYHKAPNVGHDAAFTLLNTAEPMGIYTGYTGSAISAFEVSGGGTFIDHFDIMRSAQAATPGDAPPTYAAIDEIILDGDASAVQFAYIGTTGLLSGELGDMLAELFANGDQLHFWDTGTQNSVIRELVGGNWDGDFTITPSTGFFIVRGGAEKPRTVSLAYSTPSDHTGLAATPVAGTGWTLLAVPHTAGNRPVSDLGLPGNDHDQLFLRTTDGWDILRYDGAKWVRGSTAANAFSIPAGRSFWYRNRGGATTWPALD